jgi:hypothetical protein
MECSLQLFMTSIRRFFLGAVSVGFRFVPVFVGFVLVSLLVFSVFVGCETESLSISIVCDVVRLDVCFVCGGSSITMIFFSLLEVCSM